MRILPIGSGKGGVGKSLIAANLSIALSQAGKRVVLADLDFGGSNLHTILGFRSVNTGLGTFLNNSKLTFDEIILETEFSGLRFVPGDAEIPGLANLKGHQKKKLLKNLLTLEADYLILDLSAGTHSSVMDFFLLSSFGLVVITPTLTSILNAYLFLKNAVFRILYTSFPRGTPTYQLLENLRKQGTALQRIYVPDLIARIEDADPEAAASFENRLAGFRPGFVLNMIEDPKDDEKAAKLRRSCREYLSTDIQHLGILYRDELQDIALGARLPIIIYKPNAVLSQAIYRLADKLIQSELEEDSPIQNLDQGYQTAEMEAETDFQSKLSYIEDLLHTGVLSMGDLVEAIKSQQFELSLLKRENQLLKTKLSKAVREGFEL